MLTAPIMRRLWPRAPQSKIDAIVKVAPAVFSEYGINNDLECAHLMAQISHENGAGTIVRENMNYTTPRQILKIFGAKEFSKPVGGQGHTAGVTPDEAERLARHPKDLAERVYGLGNPKKAKELGNARPGDGWIFRGNGDLQLTGGANHKKIGDLVGFDLYGRPEQLEDPAISFRVAVAEFVKLKCLPAAQDDNINLVTKRVNGGFNGIAERTVWLRKWKTALAEDDGAAQVAALADVPPPADPRGGESDQPQPAGSTIIQGSSVGGGLGLGAVAYQVWEAITSAPEGILSAGIALAQKPGFWFALAIVGLFGFIFRQRLRKILREGV